METTETKGKIKVDNPNGLPTINYYELEDLQGDLKTITNEELGKLKASILKHGIFLPKLVWYNQSKYWTLDGHQTKKALKSLSAGYDIPEIPIVKIKATSKKNAIEKILIINSRYGKINRQTELLGFYEFELDDLIDEIEIPELKIEILLQGETAEDDEVPEEIEPVTQPQDIWALGQHRILCGNIKTDIEKLMGNNKIDCLITDPPYNVDYSSKNRLLNAIGGGHRIQIPIINDNMSPEKYKDFVVQWFSEIEKVMADYNSIYIFGTYESLVKLYDIKSFKVSIMLVWLKNQIIFGRMDYKGKHEYICYGWIRHHKWYGLTNQTSVLEYDRPLHSDLHPTMKPVALLELLLLNSSQPQQKCLDAFMGSGSTLIACEKHNRICYGMELDPHYCDVTVQRYKNWCIANEKTYIIKRNGKLIEEG